MEAPPTPPSTRWWAILPSVGRAFLSDIHYIEQIYIELHNIYAFISQMMFFSLCSVAFHSYSPSPTPEKNEKYALMALKTLLFYSVGTYFVAKTKDICTNSTTRGERSHSWNFTEGICKVILEWAKAIIVILCLREQGISFEPSTIFAVTTFNYYLFTEKVYLEILQAAFERAQFQILDNLENLYIPLCINLYLALNALVIVLYVVFTQEKWNFLLACAYFLIYIRLRDAYWNYWKRIVLEKHTFDNFRNATKKELEDYDDICAVCLNVMTRAKITPCNHYFHPHCLKECLKTSFLCPICKLRFG